MLRDGTEYQETRVDHWQKHPKGSRRGAVCEVTPLDIIPEDNMRGNAAVNMEINDRSGYDNDDEGEVEK